ncbi:MAG: hypothetical protein RMJ98_11280 [Myxococcales bacterium]|nr:hypothetical protein [Polyangiaceae bacterium]MDW8249869.1 hypothetical protein [Myxococcales bacterium]
MRGSWWIAGVVAVGLWASEAQAKPSPWVLDASVGALRVESLDDLRFAGDPTARYSTRSFGVVGTSCYSDYNLDNDVALLGLSADRWEQRGVVCLGEPFLNGELPPKGNRRRLPVPLGHSVRERGGSGDWRRFGVRAGVVADGAAGATLANTTSEKPTDKLLSTAGNQIKEETRELRQIEFSTRAYLTGGAHLCRNRPSSLRRRRPCTDLRERGKDLDDHSDPEGRSGQGS